jgi:hypothetical protein
MFINILWSSKRDMLITILQQLEEKSNKKKEKEIYS